MTSPDRRSCFRVLRVVGPHEAYERTLNGASKMTQDEAIHTATLTKAEFPDSRVIIQESITNGASWRPFGTE